jgi:hypothetical protein
MEFSMMLKGRTSRILYTAFLALDISLFTQLTAFLPPDGMVGVARGRTVRPAALVAAVVADESKIVQSVHVDGALDLDVVQQPEDNANYVSPKKGELTQFGAVSQYGNIGLLAHNFLAGRSFSHLVIGQDVRVLYRTGETESFVITEILSYQALDPKNPYSSFQNLMNENEILSVGQMFERVYKGDHHLTFQTCIANDGVSSWGRLFVVAKPKPEIASFEMGMLQTKVSFRP